MCLKRYQFRLSKDIPFRFDALSGINAHRYKDWEQDYRAGCQNEWHIRAESRSHCAALTHSAFQHITAAPFQLRRQIILAVKWSRVRLHNGIELVTISAPQTTFSSSEKSCVSSILLNEPHVDNQTSSLDFEQLLWLGCSIQLCFHRISNLAASVFRRGVDRIDTYCRSTAHIRWYL